MDDLHPQPKRSWPRKIMLGCGGVLLAIVILGGIAGGIAFYATSGVATVGHDFMQALSSGEHATAYGSLNPSLRDHFVSPETLAAQVAQGGVVPQEWSFTSRNVENSLGELAGSVTYDDGHEGRVALKLEYVGEQWLIYDVALNR